MTAAVLAGLPCQWQGADDTTPVGCTLYVTQVMELPITYILRDDCVIGRVEASGRSHIGYIGAGIKGGTFVGSGEFTRLAQKIADRAVAEGSN